jgi:hypothetical protein
MLKFATNGGSGANASSGVALGIFDDTTATSNVPANASGVLELRCSASFLQGATENSHLYYLPVDKTKWYYTGTGPGASDPRLVIPGTLFGGSISGSPSVAVEIDYTMVFAGADDAGGI